MADRRAFLGLLVSAACVPMAAAAPVSLSEVVTDICERCGLPAVYGTARVKVSPVHTIEFDADVTPRGITRIWSNGALIWQAPSASSAYPRAIR